MAKSAARIRARLEWMRAQRIRRSQIWVTDVRTYEFTVAAHEQSLAIAVSEQEGDDQHFVDAISSTWDETKEDEW